mmetsp:Transcript_19658/g.34841  ORF Transcript_19658/g.34841 Transcript_19658/m.34841 type:complete len:246 (-) Transcript_19658:50-787(-)
MVMGKVTQQDAAQQLELAKLVSRSLAGMTSQNRLHVPGSVATGDSDDDTEEEVVMKPPFSEDSSRAALDEVNRVVEMLESLRDANADVAAQVTQELAEVRRAEGQRFEWLNEEIGKLEAGLSSMETRIGKIGVSFSGTDFQKLAEVPRDLEYEDEDEDEPNIFEPPEIQGADFLRRVEMNLKDLRSKLDEFSAKPSSDGLEISSELWQIEIALRKLNNGKTVLPLSVFQNHPTENNKSGSSNDAG